MDRKEAADLLDNLIGMIEDSGGRDYDTALKMGVEVLTLKPTDCISRQAAITLPVMPKEHREYQTFNLDDAYEQGWNDLQKCIESLPSAQPERKTGEWIEISDGIFASTYKCSKCGASPVLDEYEWAFSHYCPNCGARMVQKGEDNG